MRILSGIQPSGALHLGNYFGMMLPAIELTSIVLVFVTNLGVVFHVVVRSPLAELFPASAVQPFSAQFPGLTVRRAFRYSDTEARALLKASAVEPANPATILSL